PPGWRLVELDFRSCHPSIGFALSGDEQLAADLEHDVYQVVGDLFIPLVSASERRDAGKRLSVSMLFGLSPKGLKEFAREVLGRPPQDGTGEAVWTAWWARYPRLAAFRDQVQGLVREAQARACALEIESPSARISRFSPAEIAGKVDKG